MTLMLGLTLGSTGGCGYRPMQPSGGREPAPHMGAISMMFKHDVLALLPGGAAIDCRMRVFPVTSDRVGEAESEWTWHIDRNRQETELKIDNVTPGLKEFGATLLDETGQILGEGTMRYLVKPGVQRVEEPFVIHLSGPTRARRDVGLAVTVRPRLPNDVPTYADIQPVIAQHCVGCHSAALPFGGLQLDQFPFHSATMGDDQTDIVSTMLIRMRGDTNPMPTSGKLDAAIIDPFEAWLDGGLRVSPDEPLPDVVAELQMKWRKVGGSAWTSLVTTEGERDHYSATVPQATIGEDYEVTATVLATGGVVLHDDPARTLRITASGDMQMDVVFDYIPGQITIPIVVEE